MEIKAPKSINDLRLKHIPALTKFKEEDIDLGNDLEIKLNFIAGICSLTQNEVRRVDLTDLNKLYVHCCSLFDKIDFKAKPPKTITIKGKEYEMVNPNRVSTGWHADFGTTDQTDYARVACLMYIPKGSNYSELDETGNLKHFISDRVADFDEDFPLVTFMQSSCFFLHKLIRYKRNLEIKEKVNQRMTKIYAIFGKIFSMNWLNSTAANGKM